MKNEGSIDGIILPSHCLCISVDKGSSFVLSPLKLTTLELFLAAVASWLPYDESMTWPNPESLPLTSLYIPSQDNEGATHFNLIGQLGTPLANAGFGVLDITMYHCAHQHGLVCAEEAMIQLSHPWHLCVSDSGEWWFRGMVFLLMTLRLSFSALYFLTYMSPFNTRASSMPVWTSSKNLSLLICSSESSSHFIFNHLLPSSSSWGA